MRENFWVDVYLAIGLLALTILSAIWALRPGDDDLGWEGRWGLLEDADRDRIATAVRSRDASLTDPEEVALGAGLRRRDRRRRAYVDLAALPFLVLAGALILAGLLPGWTFLLILNGCVLLSTNSGDRLARQIWGEAHTKTSLDPGPGN
jgi:hypothetical protein